MSSLYLLRSRLWFITMLSVVFLRHVNGQDNSNHTRHHDTCSNPQHDPNLPCLPCSQVSADFVSCDDRELDDTSDGNSTDTEGPVKFKSSCHRRDDGKFVANCLVLDTIQCEGNRRFQRVVQSCKSVTAALVDFPTAIILSVLVGWTGADRYYLGHTGTGVAKTLTIGGLGVWWLVDAVLVANGQLLPKGNRAYKNYY
eukprot:c1792_g1_i1.p1 GENE.c1792_g1_i1~~c1792_g1_i1.p1  ORF type:complete len:198 (+),score=27.56 c1792_g1_i1:153-746(+)